jgi:hypothetical protein
MNYSLCHKISTYLTCQHEIYCSSKVTIFSLDIFSNGYSLYWHIGSHQNAYLANSEMKSLTETLIPMT